MFHAVAEWALISSKEAGRRINEAAELGPRRALTGEPLAPLLAGTAAGQGRASWALGRSR